MCQNVAQIYNLFKFPKNLHQTNKQLLLHNRNRFPNQRTEKHTKNQSALKRIKLMINSERSFSFFLSQAYKTSKIALETHINQKSSTAVDRL